VVGVCGCLIKAIPMIAYRNKKILAVFQIEMQSFSRLKAFAKCV
jgi:hypothetical protein